MKRTKAVIIEVLKVASVSMALSLIGCVPVTSNTAEIQRLDGTTLRITFHHVTTGIGLSAEGLNAKLASDWTLTVTDPLWPGGQYDGKMYRIDYGPDVPTWNSRAVGYVYIDKEEEHVWFTFYERTPPIGLARHPHNGVYRVRTGDEVTADQGGKP